jgi:crotonobetainyl-CoA:carnitine CoA-transferase CaiB-like acyl-CoA transferase
MSSSPLEQDASCLLKHVRIVELGSRVASGACGSLLAQLGAEVVLVEAPNSHRLHKWQCRAQVAAGKQSVVIDTSSAAGCTELDLLLESADVVLLSSDLSQSEAALWDRARPAGQIICDITAFGHTGPMAGTAHSEALVQAWSAVADTMGNRNGPPSLIGAPLLDMETAVYAASAILAALRVKRIHGFGQRIDMALFDVAVNALLTFIPLHLTGRTATRNGNRHPTLSPWNSYAARDGWVLICAPTDDQWKRLCQAMNAPDCVSNQLFATTTARMENVEELDRIIGAWVAGMNVADCVQLLTSFSLPSGPILPLENLPSEPNLQHRNLIRHLNDPAGGASIPICASSLRVDGEMLGPASIPAVDAHRGQVLQSLAALSGAGNRLTGDPDSQVRPLEGIRIVEVGMNTVAPLACKQLAALGADVIKVEPPTGDTNRWNAPVHANGESYVYALSNTDKRGIVLNLRESEDRERLFRLLETADVVIENLKPGSLDRLGVGAKDVCRRYPHLIYCSVSGFGHDSVYPGRPALDTVIQGMSGVMSATVVQGVPTKAGLSISDQLGGLFAMLGMLAAVDRKERTGRGAYLDLAMQDSSAWATQFLWGDTRYTTSCGILSAQDGFVAIEGDEQVVLHALRQFAPLADSVAAAVSQLDRNVIVECLAGLDQCAAAPVLSLDEVLAHPQTAARGLLLERQAPDGRSWTVLGSPLRLLTTPAEVRSPMPHLGFHDAALHDELGLARHLSGASNDTNAAAQPA